MNSELGQVIFKISLTLPSQANLIYITSCISGNGASVKDSRETFAKHMLHTSHYFALQTLCFKIITQHSYTRYSILVRNNRCSRELFFKNLLVHLNSGSYSCLGGGMTNFSTGEKPTSGHSSFVPLDWLSLQLFLYIFLSLGVGN